MKRMIVISLLMLSTLLGSLTYYVDINGSTNISSIQLAIDQSAWGDTIIVYPGIYHENLVLNDKQLYLRSLFYVSGDSSYIDNTIINGSQSGPCFKIINGHNLTIEGFKITNGYSDYVDLESGGINILTSNVQLRFNKITKNKTRTSGGGIFIKNANLDLVGNNVYDNTASSGGGGIFAAFSVTINFSDNYKNNIYMNKASIGLDFFIVNVPNNINIILDKATVENPDNYFIHTFLDYQQSNLVTFSCQSGVITPVQSNLYVSPSGSDDNDGLSMETPLKTINYALLIIQPDSLAQRKIILMPGIYSVGNGQTFPMGLRSYISIEGTDQETVIFDGELENSLFVDYGSRLNYKLSNFKIQNTRGRFGTLFDINNHFYYDSRQLELENIDVFNDSSLIYNSSFLNVNLNVENVTFSECQTYDGALFNWVCDNANGHPDNFKTTLKMKNTRFFNNQTVLLSLFNLWKDPIDVIIDNCIFDNNYLDVPNEWGPTAGLICAANANLSIINSDFINNNIVNPMGTLILSQTSPSGLTAPLATTFKSINNLFYDNQPKIFNRTIHDIPNFTSCNALFTHSFLEEGISSINSTNIDTLIYEDNFEIEPGFLSTGFPYTLAPNSPLVDVGLNTIPDYTFPESDYFRRPRIINNCVDLGANEYNPDVSTDNQAVVNKLNLINYPNPFNPSTTIAFSLEKEGMVNIEIYNIKGQRVKKLVNETMKSGNYKAFWNGKDSIGRNCSSGIYFCKMKSNGKSFTRKMMLIK